MIVRRRAVEPFDFEGLGIRDYTADLDVGSSLAVIEVPPGVAHRQAWSTRSDKTYLVTEGLVRMWVDGEEADLATGDLCLVRRGQQFRYRNPTDAPASLVLVHTPSFRLDAERFVESD